MRRFISKRAPAVWLTALAVIATLWVTAPAAMAGSATTWTITQMSGRVNIVRPGAAPVSLTNGDELRPGDMIETAADSGAILVRNGESIVLAPNTRMGLPESNDSGYATLILQQFGTLLLKVEKEKHPHFEVRTPYLAAVVKGTTFSVNVDTAGANVHVVEGLVQVNNKTGMSVFVRPGQTALISSAPGAGLSVKGAPANSPVQKSEVTPDQDTAAPGDSADAGVSAIEVAPAAGHASPKAFAIDDPVGTLDIDVSAATNGLVHSAAAPGQLASAAGQGIGPKGASDLTPAAGASSGSSDLYLSNGLSTSPGLAGTSPGLAGTSPGLAGTSPGLAGTTPGIAGGAPVAAANTGVLPPTASLTAQLVASPGSQGKKDKEK